MARIEHILKSRKEYHCGKCNCTIEKGMGYFRANRIYQKPIIHCEKCGIKPYEVGNEYTQQVGTIAEEWRTTYGISEDAVDSIVNELEDIKSTEEEKLENLGDNLRYSPNGEMFQERIDNLDTVISSLQEIDFDEMKDTEAENFAASRDSDNAPVVTYYELMEVIKDNEKDVADFEKYLNNAIEEAIENALSDLEY